MNYFEVQRRLNRETRYLYFLFFVMIFIAVFVTNIVFSLYDVAIVNDSIKVAKSQQFRWTSPLSFGLSLGLLLVILGNYIGTRMNSATGAAIAQNLGGTEVTGNMRSPYFRILNQAVDEMAIATGVPVPRVYVLNGRSDINAFAAGFTTSDAVIAVTEGALMQLTRSELQALVAHEMSHVVYQDMRLNMHVVAILAGFMGLTTLGFQLFRSIRFSRNDRDGRAAMIMVGFGVLLVVFGYFLYVLGRIIQSKISFRREYVADSHAVRSQRQARPMMMLLMKLNRGEKNHRGVPESAALSLENPEYQHFLFNSARSYFTFRTHPPLNKRIEAVRQFINSAELASATKELTIAELVERQTVTTQAPDTPLEPSRKDKAVESLMALGAAAVIMDQGGAAPVPPPLEPTVTAPNDAGIEVLQSANEVLARIPEALKSYLYDKEKVEFVFYAFFLAEEAPARQAQAALFNGESMQTIRHVQSLINESALSHTYVIAELSFPIIHQLTSGERRTILTTLERMMKHSGVTLRQYCLYFSLKKIITAINQGPSMLMGRRHNSTLVSALEHVYYIFSIIAQKASHYEDNDLRDMHFFAAIKVLYPASQRKMLLLDEQWLKHLNGALLALDVLDAGSKTRLINALLYFIQMDGRVTNAEYELIRFISLCLDYPLPLNLERTTDVG